MRNAKIIELTTPQFALVKPLFTGDHLALVIDAVIAGNSSGRIWADDTGQPANAFLWDGAQYYFAGDAANAGYLQALEALIATEIIARTCAERRSVYKLMTTPAWDATAQTLFAVHAPARRQRIFLKHHTVMDVGEHIPDGFTMQQIDGDLLAQRHLGHYDDLLEEITCWSSMEAFLQHGCGYCLLHGEEIVSRCTSEYTSAGKCGLGIETLQAYESQGLATLTARATINHCRRNGLTPHWDSWADNLPSLRVAEKVGFERTIEYAVWWGRLK